MRFKQKKTHIKTLIFFPLHNMPINSQIVIMKVNIFKTINYLSVRHSRAHLSGVVCFSVRARPLIAGHPSLVAGGQMSPFRSCIPRPAYRCAR